MRPLTQIHIRIPEDCLPLVAELVARLGGSMTEVGGEVSPRNPLMKTERGGKMLRALRQRAGLTQKALAEAVGVAQSHISEFEKNRRPIPHKHARKLAKVLHSIPSHFMTPNTETIAAMNEAAEEGRQTYETPEAMYAELGI